MSYVLKCDRCGKIIDELESHNRRRILPKGDGTYEIVPASRIKLSEGLRDCDLCLSCKTELYNWLFNGAPLDDELNERKARLRASSQIIAVAKEETK